MFAASNGGSQIGVRKLNIMVQAYAEFVTYAVRPINEIYHLVTRGGQHTLCGLRVSRIASDHSGNRLQLVRELPADGNICKHCERIKSQDSGE